MPTYTYTVSIDSRQALQDARRMRDEFAAAMGEIAATGGQSGGSSAGIDAGAIRARLEQITADIFEREQKLLEADIKGGLPQTDARYAAQLEDYYRAVSQSLGEEAAAIAKGSGKITNIGELGAEFASDQLVEFERNAYREVEFKRRQTIDEKREYYNTLKEIQEKELEAVRLEKQLAEQNTRNELQGFDAATIAQTLEQELAEFARREKELAETLDRTNREIANLAPKATGADILAGTATGPGGATGRVTLSATKASVANVEAMVAAGREYAETVEKVADAEARAAEERKRARSEDTNAFRRQEEIREATERRLRLEQEAAAERISAVNRSEAEAREQYRRTTIEYQEEQRRQTAELKQELRERERAARQSTQNLGSAARAGAGGAGRAIGGIGQGLLIGGLAGLGLYGADEVLRTGYQAGRTGAGQLRQAETFSYLADQANADADEIISAIQRASNGTIAETQAIALAVQILAQSFASETDNIDESLATLTAAARRYSQVFTDETGAFLTTEEIFARFVKFVREGNKELVDQFGISNQRIADALEIPNEGLRGAEGAILRYQGLLEILAEDTARLGNATESAADQIEASEARISSAVNRIRQALAEPTASAAEFVADNIDNLTENFSLATLEDEYYRVSKAITAAEEEAALLQQRLTDGTYERGTRDAAEYAAAVEAAEQELATWNEEAEALRLQLIDAGAAIADADARFQDLDSSMISSTNITYQLTRGLYDVAAAAGAMGEATTAADNALAGLGFAGQFYTDPTANPFEISSEDQSRIDYQRYSAELGHQRRIEHEQRRLAEETAKEAERAWKAAAEETARNFEAALQSVPGLFGTSDVTGEDLDLADAGLYEEKADEYLRRLRDEILNGVDYEDVDAGDAARRAGIDPNLPAEMILSLFESAWEDSSLFAGGANLDLINQDAVQAELARQQQRQSGEDAIRSLFGLGGEGDTVPAGFASDTVSAIAGQFEAGDFTTEAAPAGEAIATTLQQSVTSADAWTGTIEAIAGTLQDQIMAESSVDAIKRIGDTFARVIKAGYLEGTSDIDWSGPLIDAVAAQVLGILASQAEGESAP